MRKSANKKKEGVKILRIPRKVLSIDFGSKTIKVIEGKHTKDNIQIFKATTITLPEDVYKDGRIINHNVLVQVIEDELSKHKIRTAATHAIINSSEILIREIIIPKVPDRDIKSVVAYQAAEYLPVNVADYVVQHANQGNILEGGIEKIKILLLAIPRDMVSSHLALLKSLGLRPEILDYQGNAMAKLLEFNNVVNENYPLENLAVASIDIGYNNTKITITKNGKIEVTQIIDFSLQTLYENISSSLEYSLEDVEEQLKKLENLETIQEDEFSDHARFSNIVRSSVLSLFEKTDGVIRYYNTREVGDVLNLILLQGGLSNIPDITQMFSAYFGTPAMQLTSLDGIRWDGDLSQYATAIGGLIRTDVV